MGGMGNAMKGGMTLLLILSFPLSVVLGFGDQYLVIAAVVGFLWVLFGNVFDVVSKGVKKLIPEQQQFHNGGGTNARPVNPKPDTVPPPQNTVAPVAEMLPGNIAVEQIEEIEVTEDTRANTLAAIKQLPATIPFPEYRGLDIPIVHDGSKFHSIKLGKDGMWLIAGASGSGKGNTLQTIALAALAAGPQKVHLTILDGKGGVDYAFALDIDHADLYYADNLSAGCDAVVTEMKRRNALLMNARARNIFEYNQRVAEQDRLPLQVVIADELINFSKQDREQLDLFASMARAMGGVGFFATQYPTTDIISSKIQANVANRVVFRVASSEYTRVSLRRTKADNAIYEPSVIPFDKQGVCVIRKDGGKEILARAPEATETIVSAWINDLVSKYPKQVSVNPGAAQSVTGVSESAITTSPLTAKERELIEEWAEDGMSRRGIARQLYTLRGGKNKEYKGDGPLSSLIKEYLDLVDM